jgi:hypothetical protein
VDRRIASGRRARVAVLVVGLAGLWTIADALWGSAGQGLLRQLGVFAVRLGALLVIAGLCFTFRTTWHSRMKAALAFVVGGLSRWSRRLLPAWNRHDDGSRRMRLGERIALIGGLGVCVLDVGLTALLLRDVFPEVPYRMSLLDAMPAAVQEWAFYVAVASLKTGLALWFGIWERGREGESSGVLRWFVLGGASAFDAVLALARGLVLADQGITGAPVMVSNIVFVGFGVAVPWVVAHTGRLLAAALDPLLERLSLVRVLAAIPILIFLGAIWLCALAFVVPVGIALGVLGIAAAIWYAMEDTVALVIGQEPQGPPLQAELVVEDPRVDDRNDERPALMPRTSGGGL